MCCPYEHINPTDMNIAMMCLMLNVLCLPGLGTIINACMGPTVGPGVLYGTLQFLLTPVLIGWIWSIVHGIRIYKVAQEKSGIVPPTQLQPLPP